MRLFGLDLTWRRAAKSESASEVVGVSKAAVPALSMQSVFGGILGYLREGVAGGWQRGLNTQTREEMTANSAVFACISRIATDIAKLRLRLVERMGDGTWVEVLGASPFWPVVRKPNHFQNHIQFFVNWLSSKLMYGNTYALKARDNRGVVVRLYLLNPRCVTPLVTPDGDVYYQLAGDDLSGIPTGTTVPASEIIHDRGLTLFHPLVGVSPLHAAGMAATQGVKIQGHSAKFFENMSRPSGVLTAPGTIDQVTADRLKAHWEENFSGDNVGKIAVLGDGLTYNAMAATAEQSQLVEQLEWSVADVARCFGVPLYKINAGPMPTAGNVEALESQYYSGCLQINIEAIELCLDEGLGLDQVTERTLGTEFDIDGLLRMDTTALSEALAKQTGAGITKINEARRRLNLPPTQGGNTCYLQQQNYSLEALAKRDALPDPFSTGKPAAAPALPAPEEPEAPEPDELIEDAFGDLVRMVCRGLETGEPLCV
jgi:HK97 family phage portal protein